MLLSRGAPINVKDTYGYTPLDLAISEGHLKIARALLCARVTVII